MEQDSFAVDDIELGAGRRHARSVLEQQGISSVLVEDVVAHYTAASRSGLGEAHALEVATGVVYPTGASRPVRAESLDDFLEQVACSPGEEEAMVGGLHESLLLREPGPPRTVIGGRVYQRRSSSVDEEVVLIGVDEQRERVFSELKRLFLYNPLSGVNEEPREQGILLYGPPGTGKSSLCKYAIAQGKRLSELSGLPFTHESIGSSDHSKWMGESAKAVKRKFARASDPSGVGLVVIDDMDMVVASRDDRYASSGELHVTNQLMQELDGVDASAYHNVLFMGSTNRPDCLDGALDRRLSLKMEVPKYQSLDQHREFMDACASWADESVRGFLAQYTFDRSLAASRMSDVVDVVDAFRRGPVSLDVFSLPLEQRVAARRESFRDVSVADARRLLAGYDPCCS